jgi:phosphoglucomutase
VVLEKADKLMSDLKDSLPSLKGKVFAGQQVAMADDFLYNDPVDHSVSENQGIRIIFADGSRIVLRLSGTGTHGATLRLYVEQFEKDPKKHDQETQVALAKLIGIADHVAGIRERTGMKEPTVIT